MHKPTEEQASIISAGKSSSDSLMVTAYAGCAKSTTVEMTAHAMAPQPALALAFNVKIKKELEKRLPGHFATMTMNGLGHRAWGDLIGKRLEISDKKVGSLVSEAFKELHVDATTEQWDDVRRLVGKAQAVGMVPRDYESRAPSLVPDTEEGWTDLADSIGIDTLTPMHWGMARRVLSRNIKLAHEGICSFDDQIYMSAMFGGIFPKFPLVMVDEAQDLSPMNHLQLKRTAGGRLITVGDPKQAIYQFRGADEASMAKIKALKKDWTELPLATTFRCPKLIVGRQSHHAPGFKAYATNAPGEFLQWGDWTLADLQGLISRMPRANPSVAILCRNNAPLMSMAFKLLRKGIGVVMLGRDIGKNLTSLVKKINPDLGVSIVEVMAATRAWAEKEVDLARANRKEHKVEGIYDRADSIEAIIESTSLRDGHELIKAIEDLFRRESGLFTLATGHRAKGLEWDIVLHLDSWRIPSKFALAAATRGNISQLEQEKNLLYVIETRTKSILINADIEDFS